MQAAGAEAGPRRLIAPPAQKQARLPWQAVTGRGQACPMMNWGFDSIGGTGAGVRIVGNSLANDRGLHLSMFRFRGTTLCIGEDAESRDSMPLATGIGDWRSWMARGVCIGNLADPSTSRRCTLAWRRLGGRKIEQGESQSASRVMFHAKVRCSGHVRPNHEVWALPVRKLFFVSPFLITSRIALLRVHHWLRRALRSIAVPSIDTGKTRGQAV